jgi:hypothetical protein
MLDCNKLVIFLFNNVDEAGYFLFPLLKKPYRYKQFRKVKIDPMDLEP